jgi:uncharacterized protein (TIGR00730 family)
MGRDPRHRAAAVSVARELVERGISLVYGGARVGLMGVVADEVLARGGSVTGVIPRGLVEREIAHSSLLDLRVVETMHARKALMAELSDAFIALPGGYGTLEEVLEAVTWVQLGIHDKPVAVLNVGGYYDGLLRQVEQAVEEAFIPARNRGLLLVAEDPATLLDRLERWTPATPSRP